MASTTKEMQPEEMLRGLLAALVVEQHDSFSARIPELHRAFYYVIQELKQGPIGRELHVDLFDVDFDPLYEQSGWFDRQLSSKQRDWVIGFSNPDYRIQIKYDQAEANAVLDAIGYHKAFANLAKIFTSNLGAAQHQA